jgi:hypothetical protein
MATATAEPRSVPATEGDGHKHKKNALSDGQGRLAWILLAPTLIVILVVAGSRSLCRSGSRCSRPIPALIPILD